MNIDKIQALMALLKTSDIQELRLEDEDGTIELKRGAGHTIVHPSYAEASRVVSEPAPLPCTQGTQVKAPLVATYYSRKSPSTPPFVSVGDKVKVNQALCILEAMKVMNEVKSLVSGTIVKVARNDGDLVAFDDVLFEIEEDHV